MHLSLTESHNYLVIYAYLISVSYENTYIEYVSPFI